ncbi:hypothetical protein ZTR_03775 [Talaromyces verruculosus]|nr:hypothetical protein ZTR_03775 [Talaromyces verruculosus]
MEHLWDVPYIHREEDAGDPCKDSQETGAIDSEPIELGTIDLTDSSFAESSDEDMIDEDTLASEAQESSRQAAESTSSKETAQHPTGTSGSSAIDNESEASSTGSQQMETREMAAAKQNLSIETNACGIQPEMRGSSKRVNYAEPESASPRKRSKPYVPDIGYDPDLPLEVKYLPCIKFEKAFTCATREWEPRVKNSKGRLKKRARPFTELEDTWEKYLEYAKCILRGSYGSQDMYLKRQRRAMLTFARSITPRVLRLYAKTLYGSERDFFFDALDREIHSESGLSDV